MHWVRRQRGIASMVALSLAFKLILAALHVPIAVAATGIAVGGPNDATAAPSLTQLIICTPSGVRTLTLDSDGHPIDGSETPNLAAECGLCSVLHAGLFALAPDTVDLAAPQDVAATLVATRPSACMPTSPRLARGHDPPRLS